MSVTTGIVTKHVYHKMTLKIVKAQFIHIHLLWWRYKNVIKVVTMLETRVNMVKSYVIKINTTEFLFYYCCVWLVLSTCWPSSPDVCAGVPSAPAPEDSCSALLPLSGSALSSSSPEPSEAPAYSPPPALCPAHRAQAQAARNIWPASFLCNSIELAFDFSFHFYLIYLLSF